MFITLKNKSIVISLIIALTIIIVIGISAISVSKLNETVNYIVASNYKSIHAVTNMVEAIEEQNTAMYTYANSTAMYTYANSNENDSIDKFNYYTTMFYKWYNIECDNITENNEKDYVVKINQSQEKFLSLFKALQKIKKVEAIESSKKYYITKINPSFQILKKQLKELSGLNEKAMFINREFLVGNINKSIRFNIFICISLIFIGFITFRYVTNKTIQTMDSILETVKIISDPLIILDKDYNLILMNKSCEKLFDVYDKNFLNKSIYEFIKNKEVVNFIENVIKSENNEPQQKIIYIGINNDNYYFNLIVRKVTDSYKENHGVVVIFENVTKEKQLEDIKKSFIAMVSHEFKTPLTSIMMGATLLEEGYIGTINDKQRQIISTIKEEGDILNTLVTNLLKLSKIKSKESIFNIGIYSISDIIDASLKSFNDIADNKGVQIKYNLDKNLPNIKVDFEKTTWVMNNLISNALRYTEYGDSITIDIIIRNDKMCVSVIDTGKGIPTKFIMKIFDKFVQVSDSDSEAGGTGLGLAIAKEIVEACGGEIWCESEVGKGTSITFTLPIVDEY